MSDTPTAWMEHAMHGDWAVMWSADDVRPWVQCTCGQRLYVSERAPQGPQGRINAAQALTGLDRAAIAGYAPAERSRALVRLMNGRRRAPEGAGNASAADS